MSEPTHTNEKVSANQNRADTWSDKYGYDTKCGMATNYATVLPRVKSDAAIAAAEEAAQ